MRRVLKAWLSGNESWYLAVGLANLMLGTSSVLIPLTVSRLLGGSVGAVGILSSLVSLAGVVGSLVWGRLSDAAHRRKPFIVMSYAMVAAMLALIALATSIRQLYLFNMLLNLFWVANASVTVLVVIENREESTWESKIGHLNQIGTLGWVAGLALGTGALAGGTAWLGEQAAFRALFFLIAGIGAVATILAVRLVPRTRARFTERRFRGVVLEMGNFLIEKARFAPFHLYHRLRPRRILESLRSPQGFRTGTKRFFGSTFLAFLGLGLFAIPLTPMLSERFGLPSSIVFLYYTLQHVAIVLAYPLAARRIKRRGNRSVQFGALSARLGLFACCSIFLAWVGATPPPWALIIAFFIYGITWSYFQLSGVALTSRLAKPENRGMALGLYNALAGVGWMAAGLIGGSLAEVWGYAVSTAAAVGTLALSLVVLLFVPEPTAEAIEVPCEADG